MARTPKAPLHPAAGATKAEGVRMRYLTPLMTALLSAGALCSARADVMGCLVEPDRVADVGTQSVGVLESLMVERGDKVVAGQVMARLTAQVERASVSVAEARSQVDAELGQALAAYGLAERKLERTRDLLKKDFVSDQALDQAEAEARVAEKRVAQARESLRVAQREYRLSAAQLGQRDVRSPFEGIVVERYRTEGERIEREPVVRVARIDPLRVEAIVPAAQFGSIAAGQQATIKTDVPGFGAMAARVTLVDRVIDPASNSFRVRLTLPNPDHRIPSGLRCRVDFTAAVPPATATSSLPAGGGKALPGTAASANAQAAGRMAPPPAMPVPARSVLPARPGASLVPNAAPVPAPRPRIVQEERLSLPSTRVVTAVKAPERLIVKQYLGSREPKLALAYTLSSSPSSSRPAPVSTERTLVAWLR